MRVNAHVGPAQKQNILTANLPPSVITNKESLLWHLLVLNSAIFYI